MPPSIPAVYPRPIRLGQIVERSISKPRSPPPPMPYFSLSLGSMLPGPRGIETKALGRKEKSKQGKKEKGKVKRARKIIIVL